MQETAHRSYRVCVYDVFLYMNTPEKWPCHHTFRVCDRCFDLFLPQCSSLLRLVRAGGILPACLSAETAFLCIPLIQEPKVIDGFNKARCNTPNKWADAGFITNICILGAVTGADDGRRFHDIPLIRVWTRHIKYAQVPVCLEALMLSVMTGWCVLFCVTQLSPSSSGQSLFHKNSV